MARPHWIPQANRSLSSMLHSIAAVPPEAQVSAIKRAPKSLRDILIFSYCGLPLALPKSEMKYIHVSPSAFPHPPRRRATPPPDEDVLAGIAHALCRLFCVGLHPTLSDSKREILWRDFMERLDPKSGEVEMMDRIRIHRTIENISVDTVRAAGLLDVLPAPAPAAEPISYMPLWYDPTPAQMQASAPAQHQPLPSPEARARYNELYARLRFG